MIISQTSDYSSVSRGVRSAWVFACGCICTMMTARPLKLTQRRCCTGTTNNDTITKTPHGIIQSKTTTKNLWAQNWSYRGIDLRDEVNTSLTQTVTMITTKENRRGLCYYFRCFCFWSNTMRELCWPIARVIRDMKVRERWNLYLFINLALLFVWQTAH